MWWIGASVILALAFIGRSPPPMTVRGPAPLRRRCDAPRCRSPRPHARCGAQEFLIYVFFSLLVGSSTAAAFAACEAEPAGPGIRVCTGARSATAACVRARPRIALRCSCAAADATTAVAGAVVWAVPELGVACVHVLVFPDLAQAAGACYYFALPACAALTRHAAVRGGPAAADGCAREDSVGKRCAGGPGGRAAAVSHVGGAWARRGNAVQLVSARAGGDAGAAAAASSCSAAAAGRPPAAAGAGLGRQHQRARVSKAVTRLSFAHQSSARF